MKKWSMEEPWRTAAKGSHVEEKRATERGMDGEVGGGWKDGRKFEG